MSKYLYCKFHPRFCTENMKIAVAGGLRNFLTIEKYDSMENDPKDATELKIAVRHISLYT